MIKIEKATINDFENINLIAREVHEQHIQYRPDIFESVEHPIDVERLKLLIENNEMLIAKIDDEIIGYIICNIQLKDHHGLIERKIFFIEQLAIKQTCHGKGLGRQIMNSLTELAHKENCTYIELTVSPENIGAIAFYEKIGMTTRNIKYSMKI